MTHTKTPWLISTVQGSPGIMIGGDDGSNVVCDMRLRSSVEANAAFIVKACNAHDELVEACKEAHLYLSAIADHDPDLDPEVERIAGIINEAIAEA